MLFMVGSPYFICDLKNRDRLAVPAKPLKEIALTEIPTPGIYDMSESLHWFSFYKEPRRAISPPSGSSQGYNLY
jgi:hypothetical protein